MFEISTILILEPIVNVDIKSAEISVDAATKETYEKIRLGGKWEDIQFNLNYIKNISLF